MKAFYTIALLCALSSTSGFAQTGTPAEPVRYVGGEICNPRLHDGGFRYAIGTENIQVMRANRTTGAVFDPNLSKEDSVSKIGWTYNHAPNLTYLQYFSTIAYLCIRKQSKKLKPT